MTGRRARRANVAPSMPMDFHLPPHVSFGMLGDRAVALDLDADRYLLIPPQEAAAFAVLRGARQEEAGDAAKIESLARRRLIAPGEGAAIEPVVAEALRRSALEAATGCGHVPLLEAVRLRTEAGLRLRLFGLKATLCSWRRLRSRHQRQWCEPRETDTAAHLAQAYAKRRVLLPARRLCVPDSLALARLLWRRGVAADVYFGVRLNPFMAHAWVQCGDLLLSDRLNTVAEYGPVFRL